MATSYTSLLGFALPVTGELDGTWGDVVNNSITQLVEDSVAGTATASVTSGNWTLSTTGSGAANEARCAIIRPTGTPGVSRNVIAPASSKAYIVDNQSNAAIVFKAAATTGVTIQAGKQALVAWNGSDFVQVGASAGGSNTQVQYNDNGTLAGSANLTFNGTTLAASAVDTTDLEVTNIKAKDGTTNISIADSTGIATFSKATVIATTDNTNAALRITQIGTGNALVVEDSSNPDSTPFVVNQFGQVLKGYGTSISYQTMGLSYTSGAFQIAGADGNASGQLIAQYNTGSSLAIPTLVLAKSKNATVGSHTAVASGDSLGAISYDGSDGTNFIEAARVWAQVDGAVATNDMPGRLVFSTTASGASSPTERMRIDSAGNVGIGGTAAAYVKQHLLGTYPSSSNITQAIRASGTIPSTSTTSATIFQSIPTTQAASFTCANLYHFGATQQTFGAGSSVTTQAGFVADSTLTGATNNYGFYSNIASGTGRWNFYANGTATNFFGGDTILGGKIGLGTAGSPSYGTSGQVLTSNGSGSAPTWQTVASPAKASGALIVNTTTVSENYTLPSGSNAFSVGPVTVASGFAVTVSSGQRWVVI